MKYIKHFVFIFLLIIPTFLLFNVWDVGGTEKAIYEYETITEQQPKVYITKYGECYHSAGCQYLWNSSNPIGLYKAKSEGYFACSVCGGTSYGTITVTYQKQVLVGENHVKNIGLNIGLSVITVLIIYPMICGMFNYIREQNEYKSYKENHNNNS